MLGNLSPSNQAKALLILNDFNVSKFTVDLNTLGFFGSDEEHATILYAKSQASSSLDKFGKYFINKAR